MRTIKIKLYEFDELLKEVQEKVIENNRDINTDYDWFKYTLDEEASELDKFGYHNAEINFNGFSSQGDGACFSCVVDIEKWIKFQKKTKDYPVCTKHHEFINATIRGGNNHYVHSNTMSVDIESDYDRCFYDTKHEDEDKLNMELTRLEKDILSHAMNEADRIYGVLEAEYYALMEDEAIVDTIKANEYTFEANGRMRNE